MQIREPHRGKGSEETKCHSYNFPLSRCSTMTCSVVTPSQLKCRKRQLSLPDMSREGLTPGLAMCDFHSKARLKLSIRNIYVLKIPNCLHSQLTHSTDTPTYPTRHATRGLFTVPKPRMNSRRRTVLYSAMIARNSLLILLK